MSSILENISKIDVALAQYNLPSLRRIRKYLTLDKAKLLGNALLDSQFNYAPLIWMFCHKITYLKMQKIIIRF